MTGSAGAAYPEWAVTAEGQEAHPRGLGENQTWLAGKKSQWNDS